jgi:hypothetical protein
VARWASLHSETVQQPRVQSPMLQVSRNTCMLRSSSDSSRFIVWHSIVSKLPCTFPGVGTQCCVIATFTVPVRYSQTNGLNADQWFVYYGSFHVSLVQVSSKQRHSGGGCVRRSTGARTSSLGHRPLWGLPIAGLCPKVNTDIACCKYTIRTNIEKLMTAALLN